MHEIAIAQSIIDIVLAAAQANNAKEIKKVQVKIGQMTAVEPEALMFCFNLVARDTLADKAELVVNISPLTAQCLDCGEIFAVQELQFSCLSCHSHSVHILTGRELQVEHLEVEE